VNKFLLGEKIIHSLCAVEIQLREKERTREERERERERCFSLG
jgi:hypothetical protein